MLPLRVFACLYVGTATILAMQGILHDGRTAQGLTVTAATTCSSNTSTVAAASTKPNSKTVAVVAYLAVPFVLMWRIAVQCAQPVKVMSTMWTWSLDGLEAVCLLLWRVVVRVVMSKRLALIVRTLQDWWTRIVQQVVNGCKSLVDVFWNTLVPFVVRALDVGHEVCKAAWKGAVCILAAIDRVMVAAKVVLGRIANLVVDFLFEVVSHVCEVTTTVVRTLQWVYRVPLTWFVEYVTSLATEACHVAVQVLSSAWKHATRYAGHVYAMVQVAVVDVVQKGSAMAVVICHDVVQGVHSACVSASQMAVALGTTMSEILESASAALASAAATLAPTSAPSPVNFPAPVQS
jgi:hypothetical protein